MRKNKSQIEQELLVRSLNQIRREQGQLRCVLGMTDYSPKEVKSVKALVKAGYATMINGLDIYRLTEQGCEKARRIA